MSFMMVMLSGITTMFLVMKHPLSLVLMLIMLTIFIMLFIMTVMNMSWLSMILFLVFLGGLLIIFTYLSALVPNEAYFFNLAWLLILMSPLITLSFWENTHSNSQKMNMVEMMNMNNTSTIYFFLSYLLIALLTTMLMSQYLKSPLNQNNY